jgi:hypothetical protein
LSLNWINFEVEGRAEGTCLARSSFSIAVGPWPDDPIQSDRPNALATRPSRGLTAIGDDVWSA